MKLCDSYLIILKVCSMWFQFAMCLELKHWIPTLSVSKSRYWSDCHRMRSLMDIWKLHYPKIYTIKKLLTILRKLELRDMETWLHIVADRRRYSNDAVTLGDSSFGCKLPDLMNSTFSDYRGSGCLSPISESKVECIHCSRDSGLSSNYSFHDKEDIRRCHR